jgi:hypothetical protein
LDTISSSVSPRRIISSLKYLLPTFYPLLVIGIFRGRRPSLEGDLDLPSQPSRIDKVRIGRSRREAGLPLRTYNDRRVPDSTRGYSSTK